MTNNQLICILSIDSICLEVSRIFLSYISAKKDVVAFLDELHRLLSSDEFDMDIDLELVQRKKNGTDQKFSTPYTLLDLDYDTEDIVNHLKELKLSEYSETKIDTDDVHPPVLFVFGKDISDRLIYVKLKIRDGGRKVVCVSFNYAKRTMLFPYR